MTSGIARAVIVAGILLAAAGLTQWVTRTEQVPLSRSFRDFPMLLADWQGVRSSLDQEIYNVLGVEEYVLADYLGPGKGRVNLYVGYYQSQKKGDIIHSPKNCLPGAGWKIMETAVEEIRFEEHQAPVRLARLLLKKGDARQVVLYWFQSRGRIISSEYMQKIWLVLDSITRQRTDGSFVRLISPVEDSVETTVQRLKAFARAVKPQLDIYIPS